MADHSLPPLLTGKAVRRLALDFWGDMAYLEQGRDAATPVLDIIHVEHFCDFARDVLGLYIHGEQFDEQK